MASGVWKSESPGIRQLSQQHRSSWGHLLSFTWSHLFSSWMTLVMGQGLYMCLSSWLQLPTTRIDFHETWCRLLPVNAAVTQRHQIRSGWGVCWALACWCDTRKSGLCFIVCSWDVQSSSRFRERTKHPLFTAITIKIFPCVWLQLHPCLEKLKWSVVHNKIN